MAEWLIEREERRKRNEAEYEERIRKYDGETEMFIKKSEELKEKGMSGISKDGKFLNIKDVYSVGFRDIASGSTPDMGGSLKGNYIVVLDVELEVPHSVLLSLAKDIAADLDIDYKLGINFVLNFHITYELVINFVLDVPVTGNITISIWNEGEIKIPTFSDLSTCMIVACYCCWEHQQLFFAQKHV
ncbi:hypothetical protein AgCh_016502 [Apium graveolens]